GSRSRKRMRIERRPRIPSRWPLPPQPQKLSFGSSVTTVCPPSHPFARGIPAEADAVAERPHARELVQFAVRRGDARRHGVGVIEDANGNAGGFALERSRKRGL